MPISPQITITPEDISFKSFAISAVTYTATTATYTATGHTLNVGDIVQITGLAPDDYNGTYTITGKALNTFTIDNSTNTALTDQTGNVYWADPTEYEYDGGQSVVYIPNSADVASDILTVENMVNGKNKIYRQATAPTTGLVEGDIWFDTSNGNRQYYWNGTSWLDVQDTAIAAAASAAAAAQAAATAAQTTADGKNRVYRQTSQPTGGTYAEGDLWFDTDDDNKIYRYTSGSWGTAVTLGNNALANLSANKITSGTIDASVITVSNINAGNISTGTLAADRIAAASITGSKIAAGTITASNILAGTITAAQIATATITATQIAAGTITTDKLVAGTLAGYTIQSLNAAFVISSTGSISGADTIGCNSLTASGTVSGSTVSATNTLSGGSLSLTGSVTTDLNLNSTSELRVPYAYSTTTSNASNVWISSTGQFRRSTASSERYKTDIVDLVSVSELDPKALYSLPVRAFRFKPEHLSANDDRANVLIPGFIAEEVDAIYPIAADYIQGNGVESWNDRILVPALLALVQDLNNRLKALEG